MEVVVARALLNTIVMALNLGRHRVEAGNVVDNVAARTVFRRCGFAPFGTAPRYLWIAGRWRTITCFNGSFTATPSEPHMRSREVPAVTRVCAESMSEEGHHCRHETHWGRRLNLFGRKLCRH